MNASVSGMQESAVRCYESLNDSCPRTVYPLTLRLSLYFLFSIIIILTVSGNLLVIVILLSPNPLPAATSRLILSLSVAGVLIGGLVMPYSMVHYIQTCWYFGPIFCEFLSGVDVVLCNTTMWHLTFISVDRYLAICYPLRYRNLMTNTRVAVMIVSSWSLALAFAVLISHPDHKIRGDVYEDCVGGCSSFHAKEVVVEYGVTFYFIPVCVLITLYSRIFAVAQKHAKVIHSQSNATKHSTTPTAKDLKVTKSLVIIVGTFLFCWTPYFLCIIIDPFIVHSINDLLYDLLMWVAYLNPMFNPFIYVFFNSWFRKTAKILINKLFIKI